MSGDQSTSKGPPVTPPSSPGASPPTRSTRYSLRTNPRPTVRFSPTSASRTGGSPTSSGRPLVLHHPHEPLAEPPQVDIQPEHVVQVEEIDHPNGLHDIATPDFIMADPALLAQIAALVTAMQVNHPAGGVAGNQRPPQKLDTSGIPDKLSASAKPAEFERWYRKWINFATLRNITSFPREMQVAAFYLALSDDLAEQLQDGTLVVNPATLGAPTVAELIPVIRAHLRKSQHIALDRTDFFMRRQQAGETIDQFHAALRELARTADLANITEDGLVVTVMMLGVQDSTTRQKLMALPTFPTREECYNLCRTEEAAHKSSEAAASSSAHWVGRSSRPPPPGPRSSHKGSNRRCNKCGRPEHQDGEHCKAKDSTCRKCQRVGHWDAVCRSTATAPPGTGPRKPTVKSVSTAPAGPPSMEAHYSSEDEASVTAISVVNQATHLRAPRISVKISVLKVKATTSAEPDSGAEVSVMPTSLYRSLGLPMEALKKSYQKISSGTGHHFDEVGTVKARLEYFGRTVWEDVHVCNDAKEFLLAWYTLPKLDILPDKYPLPIHGPANNAVSYASVVKGSSGTSSVTKQDNSRSSLPDNSARLSTIPDASIPAYRQQLLQEFSDVFASADDEDLRPMVGDPMKIHIKPDAVPVAITAARNVPIPLRSEVRAEIKRMVSRGVITPVGDEVTEWIHPLVLAPKKNGKVRIVTDFTALNRHATRPHHPMRTPKDAVDAVSPKDRYFSTLDAVQGYWQIPLAKESRPLTTFICSEGRFQYCRAPMGLLSTGDEYNRRGDIAIAGLSNVEKVVDDLLVHDVSLAEHVLHVRQVLQRCRDNAITLSREKFVFAQPAVKYVGYIVTRDGIAADPDKVSAIKDFPSPKNISELRGFLGLVNQLGSFSDQIAKMAEPLRPLLQKSNKYLWLANHEQAFRQVKEALIAPPILKAFDVSLPTVLKTDASRSNGLGFALLQRHGDRLHLVQCGSRFVTPTESRYAVVELEMLAVEWAVNKCRVYLLGLPEFSIITDHKPLVPILNQKGLHDVDNPRLMRMKERLLPYRFSADWIRGKDHEVPDALSRAPVSRPTKEDIASEQDLAQTMNCYISCNAASIDEGFDFPRGHSDRILDDLYKTAIADENYQMLKKTIISGFPDDKSQVPPTLMPYYAVRDSLSVDSELVLSNARIVIPQEARKEVLLRLHSSHLGNEYTKRRAREAVWWPGINSDIENTIATCQPCQLRRSSLPAEPLEKDELPTRPWVDTATDLFTYGGQNYIVYVDRYSGCFDVGTYFKKDPTAERVCRSLRTFFLRHGPPIKIRSDGGPQYTATYFQDFCNEWKIHHVRSAPHFPSSNGLAEAAVKSAKALIAAAMKDGEFENDAFVQGYLEWENTPRPDGQSPASMVYRHPMRTLLPQINNGLNKGETQERVDGSSPEGADGRPLQEIPVGSPVWVQDPRSLRWSRTGEVTKAVGRNYAIKMSNGGVYWRNRRHIRLRILPNSTTPPVKQETKGSSPPSTTRSRTAPSRTGETVAGDLRRSSRATKVPVRFRVEASPPK
jgi:hypothetical protein